MKIIHYIDFKNSKWAYWLVAEDSLFQAEVTLSEYELEQSRLNKEDMFDIKLNHILADCGKRGLKYFHFREEKLNGKFIKGLRRRYYFTTDGNDTYRETIISPEDYIRFKSEEFQELFKNLIIN